MIRAHVQYPEGGRGVPNRQKIAAKYAMPLDDLARHNDVADIEDAIFARLDQQIKALIADRDMVRARGITHEWVIVELAGMEMKEYRALTVADPAPGRLASGWD